MHRKTLWLIVSALLVQPVMAEPMTDALKQNLTPKLA